MSRLRPLHAAIRLAVGSLLLAVGLRSWLVMGLVEPVTVAGSSMAPTLRGEFVAAQCPKCHQRFSVGTEFAASAAAVPCPHCGCRAVSLTALPWQHGDRLCIDRTTFARRAPKRWEVVVARNPEDAAELCVKRVVGLPGETVSLRDGNVLIDGATLVKSPAEQRRLRQVVHREHPRSQRWRSTTGTCWHWDGQVWQHHGSRLAVSPQDARRLSTEPGDGVAWLRYQQPRGQPLTDDVPDNVGLTRQLNLVDEFMLSTELTVQGKGMLLLTLDDGLAAAQVSLRLPDGKLTLWENGRPTFAARLSTPGRQRLAAGKVLVELSNFDQQLLLTVAGQVELVRPWPHAQAAGTDRPVSIGARGLTLRLDDLTLYRDIYHGIQAVSLRPPPVAAWQLGAAEYFLLGDNSPVSLDSRKWGPVPGRLLVGKPLGVR